jgi:hypothetical protein
MTTHEGEGGLSPPAHHHHAPGIIGTIMAHLPPWLAAIIVAFVAWLVLPQNIAGGLRWIVVTLRQRRPTVDKRRADRRARFASAMVSQVTTISRLEEWQDERFAELDAEVEIHGRQRRGLVRRRRETIRRVPSLSRALEKSQDRIILLEGEPGSGKSVALRHVAIRLASQLRDHPSEAGVIPIFLNLKEFRPASAVDAGAIRDFLRSSINRANDRYVEIFLDDEFDRGVEDGTWLFLFDSFDEIPAILGATEADEIIEQHAGALYDFLTGMNTCRGIIASREFRGPKRINWTRFRVLRLTDPQRRELIAKLDLPRETERRLLAGLTIGDAAVRQMADNPLFLALLCEHQRGVAQFPGNSHVVFEDYVAKRFRDDRQRLLNRFGLEADSVRAVAEQAAYCMAARPGLGLSPLRDALIAEMRDAGFAADATITAVALDALEYLRLARAVETMGGQAGGFTFAHRRFQEYFATCFVMRDGSRVEPLSLLTDGRWRETAVTLLQTQDKAAIQPMLEQAESLLATMTGTGPSESPNVAEEMGDADPDRPFAWPPGALHLLGILQDGLPMGDPRRSPDAEELAGGLLTRAYAAGQLHDKRWAVEVCLAASASTACEILRDAFDSGSGWLREAAYAQAGRLNELPDDLRQQMRGVLAGLAAGGQLRQQRLAVDAQLQRLPDPRPERLLERLFLVTPAIDALLLAAVACAAAVVFGWSAVLGAFAACAAIAHWTLYVDRGARQVDASARYSSGLAWLYALTDAIAGEVRPRSMGGFSFLARIYLMLIFLIVLYSRVSLFTFIMISVAYLPIITWAPAAVRADRILSEPTLPKIVVLPFAWLRLLGRRVPVKKIDVSTVAVSLVVVAVAVGWVGGLIWLANRFPWISWVSMVGLLALLYAVLGNLHRRWNDYKVQWKIARQKLVPDDFSGMFSVLTRFRTQRALLLFVQDVKRRRVTADHPAVLRALQAYVDVAGYRGTGDDLPSYLVDRLEPDELAEVRDWAGSPAGAARRKVVSQAVVDEVGKMIADSEDVRGVAFSAYGNVPST